MSLRTVTEARHQAEALGNLVHALELLADEVVGPDAEDRYHARALARWILARSEAARARAVELSLPRQLLATPRSVPEQPAEAVGVAHSLLVDSDRSGEAFIACLVAEPAASTDPPAGALGELCGQAERCLFRLLARRGKLPALGGHRLRWRSPPVLERYALSGRSAEAAAALALFSLWTGRPISSGLLCSAALAEDGELQPVASLEAKTRTAFRERPELSVLLVAGEEAPTDVEHPAPVQEPPAATADGCVRGVASLEDLLCLVFGPETLSQLPALDLEGALRTGLELYEAGSFETALEVLRTARALVLERRKRGAPGALLVEEFRSRWRIGSCLVHLGDPRGALEELEAARRLGDQLWAVGEINPQAYLNARGTLAVLLRDLHRFDEAEELLRSTLEEQRALRQDKRELSKTLGNLGELLTVMGRFEAAEAALAEALDGLLAVYPEEVPREFCYLGNLALRRGEPDRAIAFYDRGLEENRRVVRGQAANAAFLRYGLARALLAHHRPAEALEVAGRAVAELPAEQVYPRQLILKQRGLAELALRLPGAEATLLAAAELGRARGALARFGVSTALGELALHKLTVAPEEQRAGGWSLLQRFMDASSELLDDLWGTGRAARLTQLLEETPTGEPRASQPLARELRETLDLFFY